VLPRVDRDRERSLAGVRPNLRPGLAEDIRGLLHLADPAQAQEQALRAHEDAPRQSGGETGEGAPAGELRPGSLVEAAAASGHVMFLL